jgi:F-type H+-transporting ATPase subunit c
MDANIALGIGIGLGFAGLGVGIGQGIAVNGALNGIARQPEAGGQISAQMLLGLVFMELVFILSFVIGFLLLGKVPSPTAGSAMNEPKAAVHSDVALNSQSPLVVK